LKQVDNVNARDARQITRQAIYYGLGSAAIFLIGIVVVSAVVDVKKVWLSVKTVPGWIVLAVLGLTLANYVIRAARFQFFSRCLSLVAPFSQMLVYYISGFAMSMSPGKVGEITRVWFLKRHYGFSYHKGLVLQIADRASDVYANLFLCLLGLIEFEAYSRIIFLLLAIFAALTALLMWSELIVRLVRGIYGVFKIKPRLFVRVNQMIKNISFMFNPKVLVWSLMFGITGWLLECYGLYLILASMGYPISLFAAMFTFAFANLAGGLTLLPGGLGGVELAMFGLLVLNKVPADAATAATIIIRTCTLWFGVSLGLLDLPLALRLSHLSKKR
jgi:uncharacterized protein (TIRG00374 family)